MARTYKPKVCVICGGTYTPTGAAQKACPGVCRKEHHRRYNASPERVAVYKAQEKTPARRAARLARARALHRKKFDTDPVYREKWLRRQRENGKKKYQADPEYREKVKARERELYPAKRADPVKVGRHRAAEKKYRQKQIVLRAVAGLAALAAELEKKL